MKATLVEDVTAPAKAEVAPFPHYYELSVTTQDGLCRLQAPPRAEILGGAPVQFGGRDDCWSPEHLLLGAASVCLEVTFRAFAEKRGMAVNGYTSHIKGVLDRTFEGPAFTSIVLEVSLVVPEADRARAVELLESAKRHCIVSHALKPPVDLRVSVVSG
jgi:organic hydroperoxide reductase OsmC/OhrA